MTVPFNIEPFKTVPKCPGNGGGLHNFKAVAGAKPCCTYCGCGPLVSNDPPQKSPFTFTYVVNSTVGENPKAVQRRVQRLVDNGLV